MKTIPLTRGFVAFVDDEDYECVAAAGPWRVWCYGKKGANAYAVRHVIRDGKYTTERMHRFIMGNHVALWDHKNGNGVDNCRDNLRPATAQQNMANGRKRMTICKSRFKGVTVVKKTGRWGSQIQVNGKHIWLGCFDLEEDAALAYNKAATIYFGEFALASKGTL